MARDWPAILSAAQARGITPIVLAREVGVTGTPGTFSVRARGVALGA